MKDKSEKKIFLKLGKTRNYPIHVTASFPVLHHDDDHFSRYPRESPVVGQILGALRTEHISAHLLSVRLSDKPLRRRVQDSVAGRDQVRGQSRRVFDA